MNTIDLSKCELAEKDAQITNLEQQRDCASDLLAKAETRMLEKDAQIAELNQRLIDRRESFQTQLVRIESTWREKLCEAQAQIVTLRKALEMAKRALINCHSPLSIAAYVNDITRALSSPPPPVVPMKDVKPLVEALRAEEIERTEFEATFPNLLKALTPSGMYASEKSQAMWESWQARAEKS